MSLEELRGKIDEADIKIVRLIAERMRIAEEIGGEKRKQGKQIEDTGREERVLENIRRVAQKENMSQEDIESIYRQIVTVSKNIQGIVESDIELLEKKRNGKECKQFQCCNLRQRVIETFEIYGGWWQVEGMAKWLDTDVKKVRKVYDELEAEGLMDRKSKAANMKE